MGMGMLFKRFIIFLWIRIIFSVRLPSRNHGQEGEEGSVDTLAHSWLKGKKKKSGRDTGQVEPYGDDDDFFAEL